MVSNALRRRTLGFIAMGVERRAKFLQNNQTFAVSLRRNVLYFGICFSLVFCVIQFAQIKLCDPNISQKEVLRAYGVMDALVKFEEQSRNASLLLFKLNECIQNSNDIRTPSTKQLINMGYK